MKALPLAPLAFLLGHLCLTGHGQSIFDNTDAPSVSVDGSTAGPTAATMTPTVAATRNDPSSETFKEFQVTFSYNLVSKITEELPDSSAAAAVVEQELTDVLTNLTTSETSGNRVVFNSLDDTKLQACKNFSQELFPLYDECRVAQSTVNFSIDPTLSSDVVKYAVIEEVQRFAQSYNRNQTDVLVLFASPKYVSTNLNVILVAVTGAMNDEAKNFFEQLFAKALTPYLLASSEIPFTLLTTQIVTQSPYDPNANSTRRSLQVDPDVVSGNGIDLSNVDPDTIPFNDLQVFVQATCADVGCTEANLQDALYSNATSYVTDLAVAIEVNRQLLLSQYFDYLYNILIIRDPQLSDLPKYTSSDFATDDVAQELNLDPPPSWVWVLCAVNVAIIVITLAWITVQSLRRETKEREVMEQFQTALEWQ